MARGHQDSAADRLFPRVKPLPQSGCPAKFVVETAHTLPRQIRLRARSMSNHRHLERTDSSDGVRQGKAIVPDPAEVAPASGKCQD